MAIITNKTDVLKISEKFRQRCVPMCVFGTGSFWNTEAILLAAQSFRIKNGIKDNIAVAVAITYNYPHMSQCSRFSYSRDLKVGLFSNYHYLNELCGKPHSPYNDVIVLPHLDHAHPERDRWALTEGVNCFASVMLDAQSYSLADNIRLTSEYVEKYGKTVMVEGILDELSVSDVPKNKLEANIENNDRYIEDVVKYVGETGVDCVVADLGTEQQSKGLNRIIYLKDRSISLSKVLGRTGIVLHGASSLSDEQFGQLGKDGVARINIWTKIARDAGKAAAAKLIERYPLIEIGDFEATESKQYIYDSITHAARIMENIMGLVGYGRLYNNDQNN